MKRKSKKQSGRRKQRPTRPAAKSNLQIDPAKFYEGFERTSQNEVNAARKRDRSQAVLQRTQMLRRIAPKNDQIAKLINQHAKRCFFYPASGLDWQPFYHLAGECDLFVFADWREGRRRVRAEINSIGNPMRRAALDDRGEMQTRRLAELTGVQIKTIELLELHVQNPPYGLLYAPPYLTTGERMVESNRKRPFAWLAEMERVARGRSRRVKLLFVNLEAVGFYWQYFVAQGMAPKFLCWRSAHGFALNWTEFHRWDKALGRAVDAGTRKPAFVGTGVRPGGRDGFDWPWNNPVQQLPTWGVTMYSRRPTRSAREARP